MELSWFCFDYSLSTGCVPSLQLAIDHVLVAGVALNLLPVRPNRAHPALRQGPGPAAEAEMKSRHPKLNPHLHGAQPA